MHLKLASQCPDLCSLLSHGYPQGHLDESQPLPLAQFQWLFQLLLCSQRVIDGCSAHLSAFGMLCVLVPLFFLPLPLLRFVPLIFAGLPGPLCLRSLVCPPPLWPLFLLLVSFPDPGPRLLLASVMVVLASPCVLSRDRPVGFGLVSECLYSTGLVSRSPLWIRFRSALAPLYPGVFLPFSFVGTAPHWKKPLP